MAPHGRGIDPKLQNAWIFSIQREDKLKLKWFRKHEDRLNEIANKTCSKTVTEEVKEEFTKNLVESFRNVERFPRKVVGDPEPVDPRALQEYMRPVDSEVRKHVYGKEADGRVKYLHERAKLTPEERYYVPECTSWVYGWNMWNTVETMKKYPFGRQEIIKASFYRRRGVERDPDWYKEPEVYNPTICT